MPKQEPAAMPQTKNKPKLLTEQQQVAGVVGVATSGGTPKELADFAKEHKIPAELLELTAAGLEDNAKRIRHAVQQLRPAPPEPEDEG